MKNTAITIRFYSICVIIVALILTMGWYSKREKRLAVGPALLTSGTTAISSSGDTAVVVFSNVTQSVKSLNFINTGTVAGFFSLDGGTTWAYLPASTTATVQSPTLYGATVEVERISGGTNVSGIYVWGL